MKTISNLQSEFEAFYPYLKLQFLKINVAAKAFVTDELIVDGACALGEIRGVLREGEIVLRSHHTIKYLEDIFQQKFSLPVQVFSRHRDGWVQTTNTGCLSLARQNEYGRMVAEDKSLLL